MTIEDLDLILGWVSLVLTLMVFSYLLGDNVLYRIAVHILVGAAAGYIVIASVEDVILPWLRNTIQPDDTREAEIARFLGVFPVIIMILLFLKSLPRLRSPRLAALGNFAVVFMVGIGTGVALVGALIGTVLPLVSDTVDSYTADEIADSLILVAGTVCTLLSFQYLSRKLPDQTEPTPRLALRLIQIIGQGFVAVTLGALYAGAIFTSLSIFTRVLNEQTRFLIEQIWG